MITRATNCFVILSASVLVAYAVYPYSQQYPGHKSCSMPGLYPCPEDCGGTGQIPCDAICGTGSYAPCGTPATGFTVTFGDGTCDAVNNYPCTDHCGAGRVPCNVVCGTYGYPACGARNCGGVGEPPCYDVTAGCGGFNSLPCQTTENGCGGTGQPACTGCGAAGQPPCPSSAGCGGANQPPCPACGGFGQPPCGGCGSSGGALCCGGTGEATCGADNTNCGGTNQPVCASALGDPDVYYQMWKYTNKACTTWTGVQKSSVNAEPIIEMLIGENVIKEMILDSTCTDMSCLTTYQEKLKTAAMRTLFGLALAVITLFIWIFFLPCACCRCWRRCPCWFCCSEATFPRNFSSCAQACGFLYLLVCVGLGVAGIVISMGLRDQSTQSSGAVVCDAFTTVNSGLNGMMTDNGTDFFPGFGSTTTLLNWVNGNLTENSTFFSNITTAGTDTMPLNMSVLGLTNALNALETTLKLNQYIGNYECIFCTAAIGPQDGSPGLIANVTKEIPKTLAYSLNGARTAVVSMLTDVVMIGALQELQAFSSLINSTWTETYATTLTKNFDLMSTIIDNERVYLQPVCLIVLLPLVMGILTVIMGLCRSDMYTYNNPNYPPANPCCASCSWCCTLLLAFLFFLFGTVIYLATYVTKSACGLLQDPAGSATSLNTRFGNPDDIVMSQIPVLVNHCFVSGADGDIVDNLLVFNQTLKQTIDYSESLRIAMAQVDSAIDLNMNLLTSPFNNQTQFLNLMSAMSNFGTLFLPVNFSDYTLSSNGATYAPTTTPAALWKMGIAGTPTCATNTYNLTLAPSYVTDGLTAMGYTQDVNGGFTIHGTQDYLDSARGMYNFAELPSTCTNITSNVSVTNSPWDDIFNMKNYLTNLNNSPFTCVSIDYISGLINGTSSCNYLEFDISLRVFAGIINGLATYADDFAANNKTELVQTLALVKSNVTDTVSTILNDLNCGFLSSGYNSLVNHLCDDKVPALAGIGLMWIVYGAISLLLVFLEFYVWRHLKDNRCLWRDNCAAGGMGMIGMPGMGAGGPTVIQMGAGTMPAGRVIIMQ